MDDLAGRNAFVTGAGSGIGRGIARNLARAGVNVVAADILKDAAEATVAEIVAAGGHAVPLTLDVSVRADVERGADQAEEALGPIHIVCNNAGVAMHGVPLERIAANDWDWVIGVNIYGVIHGIQTFVPRMRAHGEGGHVVSTASIGGLQVNPNFHTSAYSMTKYAVVALSEALEQELEGTNIGVSVLCPASVATSIHLSERSRPERLGGPTVRQENHFMGELIKDGWTGDEVGARVVDAIRAGEFYILTHTEPRDWIEKRHHRIEEAFDRADAYLARGRKDVA